MQSRLLLKRAYDEPDPADGFRIYVDRIWPRGLSHETFPYDLWDREIAPSPTLRHWFHENPDQNWPEFARRYKQELAANPAVETLAHLIASKPKVTLLYSSRDEQHNNATVLKEYLEHLLAKQ